MSALAGLVDKGLMAPDWAEALAPVDERIERDGAFLRDEIAAGRGYLPAGDDVFRAFRRPLADVRVLVVGQDPYPTPGHPIGLSLRRRGARPAAARAACATSTRAAATSVSTPPAHGDLTAWADQGVMLLNRVADRASGCARLAPRQGLGGDHRPAPSRRWSPAVGRCVAILWGRDAQSLKPALGTVPWRRVRAPVAAVGQSGLLRLDDRSAGPTLCSWSRAHPVDWSLPGMSAE